MTRPTLIAEIQSSADRHNEAACTLIAVHSFAAAAGLLCQAIETAAGYFVGSTARTLSKASFVRFACRYLPELGKTSPRAALADRPDQPLASCAEAVYAAWRGGLLHDGERKAGVRCVDDKHKWMLSFEANGSAKLSLIPFQSQFERGLAAYLADLGRDEALAARAAARAAFLAHPVFVTER